MSRFEPVRIALAGAGAMGQNHIRMINAEPRTSLVAIADPAPQAQTLADANDVPLFANVEAMLDEVKPDGIIIASPNRLHIPNAYAALSSHVPALIEKPLSDDIDAAQKFVKDVKNSDVKFLVGQHRRHNPRVRKAKEIVASGALGQLVTISLHYMVYKPDNYFDVEWRRQKGAGPILVNMVHDVDLLRYLIGEPSEIQAFSSSAARGFETEDSAVVNIRFDNGALGSITLSDASVSPWNWEATAREDPFYAPFDADAFLISGTKGALTLPRLHLFSYDGESSWTKPLDCEIKGVKDAQPHAEQLKHFCDVIEGKVEPLVTPEDAMRTLEALNRIKRAADSGSK